MNFELIYAIFLSFQTGNCTYFILRSEYKYSYVISIHLSFLYWNDGICVELVPTSHNLPHSSKIFVMKTIVIIVFDVKKIYESVLSSFYMILVLSLLLLMKNNYTSAFLNFHPMSKSITLYCYIIVPAIPFLSLGEKEYLMVGAK